MEENFKEKSYGAFFAKIFIFIALIFARNILDLPISPALLLGFSGFIALTSDKNELVALIAACIPLGAAFQFKYLILLCVIIYYAKSYKNIAFVSSLWLLIAMMMWEALHAFDDYFLFNEFFRGFAELIAITLIVMDKKKQFDYPLIVRTLSICTISMCFVVLMNLFKDGSSLADIFSGIYRFGVGDSEAESYGVNFNANGLGFICNLSVAGLLQLSILNKQKAKDYIMIFLLLFFGLLTMSRSFLICCAFVFVLFVFAKSKDISGTLKAIIVTLICICTVLFAVSKFAPFIIERIIARFMVSDISNGRIDLFSFYNSHLLSDSQYFLFGVGKQSLLLKMFRIYRDPSLGVPHNGIQEMLVIWGVPGILLFTMYLVNLVKSSGIKHKLANYIPFLFILLKVQSGQMITSGTTLLAFIVVYISFCTKFDEEV